MSGYVPIFDSVYDGTLHGKWPDAVVWVSILPLANKDGEIRMTLEAIASRTGWPMKWLKIGIDNLMQPDSDSQSDAEEGRRLIPLDPSRSWGWKVVNHSKYREKARKKSHDDHRQETGQNAARMKERRDEDQQLSQKTRDDPTSPDATRADPLSDANTNISKKASARRGARRVPEDFSPDTDFALRELPNLDVAAEVARFRDFEFKTPRSDWAAAWRNWIRTCKDTGRYAHRKVNGGIHADVVMR